MQCYDCTVDARTTPAAAVCTQCGAAVCADHARSRSEYVRLTRGTGGSTSDTPARRIHCTVCHTARYGAPVPHGQRSGAGVGRPAPREESRI